MAIEPFMSLVDEKKIKQKEPGETSSFLGPLGTIVPGVESFVKGLNRGSNEFRQAGQFDPSMFGSASTQQGLQQSQQQASQFANRGQFLPGVDQSGFRGDQQTALGLAQGNTGFGGPGQQALRSQLGGLQQGFSQQQAAAQASGRGSGAENALLARAGALGQAGVAQQLGQVGSQASNDLASRSIRDFGALAGQARGQDFQRGQFNQQLGFNQQQLNDQNQQAALDRAFKFSEQDATAAARARAAETARFNALLGTPTQNEQILGAAGGVAQLAGLG